MKKLYSIASTAIAGFGAYLVLKMLGTAILHLRDIEKRQDAVEKKNKEALDAIGGVSTAMGIALGHESGIPAKVKRLESDVRQLKIRAGMYPVSESLAEARQSIKDQLGMDSNPRTVPVVTTCPIDHRALIPTSPGGVTRCPRCGDEIHRSSRAAG